MTAVLTPPPTMAVLVGTADLVLVRMGLPSKTPPTPAVVRRDVGKLIRGTDLTADEFTAVRDDLAAGGFVAVKNRSVRLTDAGRRRAFDFLGITEWPPRTNWGTVQANLLFPKAVGMSAEASGRLSDKGKLAAFVLKRKYDLPLGPGASLAAVLEALTCRRLGHPEETTLGGLMRAVLSRLMESDERLTKAQLAEQLPLFRTGLTSGGVADIRKALVREWLTAPRPSAEPEPEPQAEFDRVAFAETVRALARVSPPADRFHDNKVFIAAVWRASQLEPGFPRMTLPDFKARLVEANHDGLLRLSRADLVQAMDPAVVAESETAYLNATFHFVLVEGDRP